MFFRKRHTTMKSISVLPQGMYRNEIKQCPSERMSPCTLHKGSLTVEAALVVPFFLLILLAFFGFFGRCVKQMELQTAAAAEAKAAAVVQGAAGMERAGRIVVQKSRRISGWEKLPFETEGHIRARAVCRAWVGFRGVELQESYVYITPEGTVYHLYGDCTHLFLSVRKVSSAYAKGAKNKYGTRYRGCELCRPHNQTAVYITDEGDCYHSSASCSGLKRTVLYVPVSQASGRGCCLRCLQREEGF